MSASSWAQRVRLGTSRLLEPAATPEVASAGALDEAIAARAARRERWRIALVVTLATFMELLDTSIANVALPQIAGNLGVNRNESTWVLTSYLVANAIAVPFAGWLSLRVGRKRFYLACVAVFTLASLLCGVAPDLVVLVVCRVLQGLGGGGLVPAEQAILVDTFPPEERGTAMALYGMTTVLAPALGPTLGGLLTDYASWRWIFLINVPIGLLSIALVASHLPESPRLDAQKHASESVDWLGLVLIAVGLGFLELVLERGQEKDWFADPMITGASAIAFAALLAAIHRQWRHPAPVLDLKLLRNRNFAIANALMMVLACTSYGVTVLLPQYLWALMGYTATSAGLVLSPGGLLIFCLLPITGRVVSRVDTRVLISGGFLMVGAAILYSARAINMEMDFAAAVHIRMLQCAGFAFLFVPIQMLAYSTLPGGKNAHAASLMNVSRNLGASLGLAAIITLIFRRRQFHQTQLVAHATPFDAEFRAALATLSREFELGGYSLEEASRRSSALLYREVAKQHMQLAYIDVFFYLAALAAVAALAAWFAKRPQPAAKPAA
jgi:DHA2 family multidrug resistance protein